MDPLEYRVPNPGLSMRSTSEWPDFSSAYWAKESKLSALNTVTEDNMVNNEADMGIRDDTQKPLVNIFSRWFSCLDNKLLLDGVLAQLLQLLSWQQAQFNHVLHRVFFRMMHPE